jgi:hypothetical protein
MPDTFAKATAIVLSLTGWSNCSDARRCSVPPCESVAVTDFRPVPPSRDMDLKGRHAENVDIG